MENLYSPGDLESRKSKLQVPALDGTCVQRKKERKKRKEKERKKKKEKKSAPRDALTGRFSVLYVLTRRLRM